MKKLNISIIALLAFSIQIFGQTSTNRVSELKAQAKNCLGQKEYVKARNLYLKAYEAFADQTNYPEAIECGVEAAQLYHSEKSYKEAFDLCRSMDQLVRTVEQKENQAMPGLYFPITKQRLHMYIGLKSTDQAQSQLNKLEEMANAAKNDSLKEDLLYTKTNYYYTFGFNSQGDACFRKLIGQYKETKDFDKVNESYKNLISIARKTNNANLLGRTYESLIAWTDSAKALTAQDELNVLKRKYDENLEMIDSKNSALSTKQYIIIGLCTLVIILVTVLAFLAILLLRFLSNNKKLKKNMQIAHEHNELKSLFIQNISEQMAPTLNALATSANELSETAPRQSTRISERVKALKTFSTNIQELSNLENTLTEPYEMSDINVANFCEELVEKIRESVKPDVNLSVIAPKLHVKVNKKQLERIVTHLLKNAAHYTTEGCIRLEFKKRGAHTHQFIITDTGSGISPELQAKIFKPFTEVKDLVQGDSLGLPICALIATKMNGNLSIDPSYTRGSRFILELHS